MTVFTAGCGTADEDRLWKAVAVTEDARMVTRTIEVARPLPPWPGRCRQQERSGVRKGERLDAALVKTDAALGRANTKIAACAGWYDGIAGEKKS